MTLERVRPSNPIRMALQAAMVSPRVQAAVTVFVNALVDEGEQILREKYAGETLRQYVPKAGGRDQRAARNLRVRSLAAAPSSLTPAQIAPMVNLTVRQVQRLLASGG